MLKLDPSSKVWLVLSKIDMRKAINGLAGIVANHLALDPMSGHYFVFANKTRTTIKILYWDRNGYSLWLKRLEEDVFRWPRTSEEAKSITSEQLQWLLAGLDWEKAHPLRKYSA